MSDHPARSPRKSHENSDRKILRLRLCFWGGVLNPILYVFSLIFVSLIYAPIYGWIFIPHAYLQFVCINFWLSELFRLPKGKKSAHYTKTILSLVLLSLSGAFMIFIFCFFLLMDFLSNGMSRH